MNDIFLPRGIRNNNPGNIRLSKTRWQGQKPLQADTSFIEFDTAVMGLRALMRVLLTYQLRYNLDTVESIINRFAPPVENATDNYIYAVSKTLGVKRRDVLDLRNKTILEKLAAAIVRHENGKPPENHPKMWYAAKVYADAAHLALQTV